MIHWKIENQEVKQGLSIYHPNDKNSIGGVLRIGNHLLRIRWSKNAKKFFVGYHKVDPNTLKDWEIKHGYKKHE